MSLGRGSIARVRYTGDEAVAEIKKLLDAVAESEDEFEKWEPLVTRASDLEGGVTRNSSPSAIELVRNVYDCFLAKFPLFFGYWKKYADFEFSIGGTETAEMVYERGVSNISSSVDLWAHYCSFKLDTCHDNDILRELFERGAHSVGLDFQSHPFWDKYIEFEERINEPTNVTKLYGRVFQLTMYQFSRYYEKFRTLLQTRPVEELADTDTLDRIKSEVAAENMDYERAPMEVERQIRGKLDHHYYEVYARVQQAVQTRWQYENAIKRAYFHVTDLEEADLENWRKYLDFEEKEGDFQRTLFLYERCLVACALYEEFWLRYARWLYSQKDKKEEKADSNGDDSKKQDSEEEHNKDEDSRLVYVRASCIFVPISQPTIRLNWARFEEKLGRISVARDIHMAILEQIPDHVETIISLASVDRRHSGNDAAVKLLEKFINERNPQVGGVLAAEQARILWQGKGSVGAARQVFKQKYERFLDSKHFWLKYLEFEAAQPSVDQDEAHVRVKEVHELMRTKGSCSSEASKELTHYYMEYLLDRAGKEAAAEFMRLDQEVNGPYSSKKSAAPVEESAGEPPKKKQRRSRF